MCQKVDKQGTTRKISVRRSREKAFDDLTSRELLTNLTRLVLIQDGGILIAFFARLSGNIARLKRMVDRKCYKKSNKEK